jgi:CRISPR system Cascade subunit CasE
MTSWVMAVQTEVINPCVIADEASLRTISRGREYFEKKGIRGFHGAVDYHGILTVTDPERFYETFTRGIGSAKAFGFGLLTIVPLN